MGMENKIDSVIYYSVALKGYDVLDFKDDALAGVRACYFEGNMKPQQGDTIRRFEKEKYSYCYSIEENKPMLWKVFKNQSLIQSSKYLPDNMYCVSFCNSSEAVVKKIYFNQKHYWIKTEYFAPELGSSCVCSLAPKVINGYFALVKTIYDENGCCAVPLFMVTAMPGAELCEAVAYSQRGMLYFTSQSPKGVSKNKSMPLGFTFTPNDFNLARNLNSTFDISRAPYLNEENGIPVDKAETSADNSDSSVKEIYSDSAMAENVPEQEEQPPVQEPAETEATEETSETQENIAEKIIDNSSHEITQPEETACEPEDNSYAVGKKPVPDKTVYGGQGSFSYYGETDENGLRAGYGRTETPLGKTAYEGQYKNDMRNGFGSFYYMDGSVNYIGSWRDNMRNGRGVGFRSSDGQAHIGKWRDNAPDGIGARFDKDGGFVSLDNYVNGVKNGLGISFDENGNLLLKKWENGREVESTIIIIGDPNG